MFEYDPPDLFEEVVKALQGHDLEALVNRLPSSIRDRISELTETGGIREAIAEAVGEVMWGEEALMLLLQSSVMGWEEALKRAQDPPFEGGDYWEEGDWEEEE